MVKQKGKKVSISFVGSRSFDIQRSEKIKDFKMPEGSNRAVDCFVQLDESGRRMKGEAYDAKTIEGEVFFSVRLTNGQKLKNVPEAMVSLVEKETFQESFEFPAQTGKKTAQ